MKKKQLVLGIVAVCLVMALIIGGTLMLFSAESKKATNVVTTGDADIDLWEGGGGDDPDDPEITPRPVDPDDPEDPFKGIEYDDVTPGDILPKTPFIKNKGTIPVYTRVVARFTVSKKDYSALTEDNISFIEGLMIDDPPEKPLMLQSLAGWDEFWDYVLLDSRSVTLTEDVGDGEMVEYEAYVFDVVFYYVDGGNLRVLPVASFDEFDDPVIDAITGLPTGQTVNIFDALVFPLEATNEQIAGLRITIDLQGQAVQSDNVDPDDLEAPFTMAGFDNTF